jgi:hypothetical protein
MPSSNDNVVLQILDEIRARGRAAGLSFHQGPGRPARYSTKAVLAAVRALADAHEIEGHTQIAADFRTMLEQADPDPPIQIEFPGASP